MAFDQEIVKEAQRWLMDAFGVVDENGDEDEGILDDIFSLSESDLRKVVDREYNGGWIAFVKNSSALMKV